MPLNFIYLHNNIYIERLDKSTLEFLQDRIDNQKLYVDPDLINVVQKTYKKVIEVFPEEKRTIKGLYSRDGKKVAWNNTLIFEIGHQSEFDEHGNYVNSQNEMVKEAYLREKLIPKLELEFSEKLNCPVTVFIEK